MKEILQPAETLTFEHLEFVASALVGGIISWCITSYFDKQNRRARHHRESRQKLFDFRNNMAQKIDNELVGWEYLFHGEGENLHLTFFNKTGATVSGLSIGPGSYPPNQLPLIIPETRFTKEQANRREWSEELLITRTGQDGYLDRVEPFLNSSGVPEYCLKDGEDATIRLGERVDELDCVKLVFDHPQVKRMLESDGKKIVRTDFKREELIPIPPYLSMKDFMPTRTDP